MKLALLVGAAVAPLVLAQAAMAAPVAEGAAVVAPAAGETVYGRVADRSGSGLPGAEIVVRETGRRVVSNASGEFSIGGLQPGRVTLDVRYLGLPNASQAVSVAAGASTTVDIVLGGGAASMDATEVADVVVVGAITDGQARALNQQKNADGVLNVLSADAIGRYPDPNVAESLQRVAGIAITRDQGEGRYINVRGAPSAFTAVSVDGVKIPAVDPGTRAVDLDTLPSDIVANVEIAKTLRPSQDADSIAGAVEIKTRSPFDRRQFSLNGYGGASYNDYGGRDTRGGLTVSNVFGPDQTFGAILSLSFSETNRKPENVENAWVEDGGVYVIEETLFKDYDTQRTRQAITGGLEWRPSDATRLWLRGSYADFEDDEYRNTLVINYADGSLQPGATNTRAPYTGARLYKQLRHRTQNNQITTVNLGGEHDFSNGAVWDASLTWAKSEQTYPHRDELVFRSGGQTVSYDATNHYAPTYSIFASGVHLNPAIFSFRENTYRANTTNQEEYAFKTNVELPVSLGGRDVELKFGAKYGSRDIDADEERFRDRTASSTPGSLASVLTTNESSNYDYNLGFKMNNELVNEYLQRISSVSRTNATRRMPDSLVADYQAREDILAGYGQARFDIGATNILLGLRVEQTTFEGSALKVDADTLATTPQTVERDYTDFFPNLTIRHNFSEDLIGRFALTRAISRPEYSDVVPRSEETTDGGRVEAEIGNPDLEPTLSNNIDAGLEYYFRPLGVVSFNAFYKDLSDYRYALTYDSTYNGLPATLTSTQNAPEGHIAGFEVNWQQKFVFLPGWLSGFGVFANYTSTDAEIKLGRTFEGRDSYALPGQSDTNYNAALFYEMAGFSARLSYTKRSDYLEEINADDAGLDMYVEGREQLDMTASYDFGNGVEIFGEAKNLTDSAGVRYYGVRERTYEYEKFGYNVFFGVRFKL
jgi:TonB-dependent receptor